MKVIALWGAVALSGVIATSLSAADRYLVATRKTTAESGIRMLRASDDFRSHAIRAFQSVDAFAADLTPDEVAALKRSPDVRFVTPVVPRYASAEGRLRPSSNGSAFTSSQAIPYGLTMIHVMEL